MSFDTDFTAFLRIYENHWFCVRNVPFWYQFRFLFCINFLKIVMTVRLFLRNGYCSVDGRLSINLTICFLAWLIITLSESFLTGGGWQCWNVDTGHRLMRRLVFHWWCSKASNTFSSPKVLGFCWVFPSSPFCSGNCRENLRCPALLIESRDTYYLICRFHIEGELLYWVCSPPTDDSSSSLRLRKRTLLSEDRHW